MKFGQRHDVVYNRHDGFFSRANLLRTFYGETGVMDFGLYTEQNEWAEQFRNKVA